LTIIVSVRLAGKGDLGTGALRLAGNIV